MQMLSLLVCFKLLQQNTWMWVVYKEKKFCFVIVVQNFRGSKSKNEQPHLSGFLTIELWLCNNTTWSWIGTSCVQKGSHEWCDIPLWQSTIAMTNSLQGASAIELWEQFPHKLIYLLGITSLRFHNLLTLPYWGPNLQHSTFRKQFKSGSNHSHM